MPNPTHPLVLNLRDMLIEQAAILFAGTPAAEAADTEYLRGLADLIANSTGAFADDDDAPLTIRDEIIRRIQKEYDRIGNAVLSAD